MAATGKCLSEKKHAKKEEDHEALTNTPQVSNVIKADACFHLHRALSRTSHQALTSRGQHSKQGRCMIADKYAGGRMQSYSKHI